MATKVRLPGGLKVKAQDHLPGSLGTWVGLTLEGGHTTGQLAALTEALDTGAKVVKVNGSDYHPEPDDWFTKRDELGQVSQVWLWVPARERKAKR